MLYIIKVSLLAFVLTLTGCSANKEVLEPAKQEIRLEENALEENALQEIVVQSDTKETRPEEKPLEQKAKEYVLQMTLEQKIGQLFMIAFRQDKEGNPITQVTPEIKEILKEYPVGGVILFKENIQDKEQVTQLIKDLQMASQTPLWIGVDEEGGMVSRVGSNSQIVEVPFQSAHVIGASKDTTIAYNEAVRMGGVLKALGFNMNFAPVADIYNNPHNTVIGNRSFGKNAEEVTRMLLPFYEGLKVSGILPVVKHFPGHGNTSQDSHEGLAYIEKSLKELEEEEIIPFKEVIKKGAEAMMIGHLMVTDVDAQYPASLSKLWGDYIKKHFEVEDVLLITDAMDMGAITKSLDSGEAALKSFTAGYDILLMPGELDSAFNALMQAYKAGEITNARLDKSVKKIIFKKMMHNLWKIE